MLYLIGLVSLGLGLRIIYSLRRRQFDRRNAFGREVFRSYGAGMITRLAEALLYCLAILVIIIALILGFVAYDQQARRPQSQDNNGRNKLCVSSADMCF